jgi:hypothetical protein
MNPIVTYQPDPLTAWMAAHDGERFPGDCPTCNAEEVVVANRGGPGVHVVEIQHDPGCAWLEERRRWQRRARQTGRKRSPRARRREDGEQP